MKECFVGRNLTLTVCLHRTLDYKRNLTLEHQAELGRANALHLSCSDVFFFELNLRSDHFGSLLELETLKIEYCKIRTLPPRSFVGLSSLQHLSIETFNSEWSAILLDIDYEAFVRLSKLKSIRLSNNNNNKEEEHFFFSEFLKSEESIAETFFSRFFLKGVSTLVVHSAEEERPTAAHLLSRGRPANKDTPKPKTTLIINFPNSAVHVI